jgi:hypothetical protein
MAKIDHILPLTGIVLCIIAGVFVVKGEPLLYGIFLAAGLGIGWLRQNEGMTISSIGLLISAFAMLKYRSVALTATGIGVACFGIYYGLCIKQRRTKEEIRSVFLEKENREKGTVVEISFVQSLGYIPKMKKKFGSYLNPTKRVVRVRVGQEEKIFFYETRKKELYETD